jgi:YidC/Oxa1 family membrane protein insertase
MIPLMVFFAKTTHSYGWAIILLTLLVRLLVWPLVASSTRNMQRMSQLQPRMKALQEKYKDDPELFRQKTMEFYSKNKMNPLGGCLPTLVQLPVLVALFSAFTGPPFQDKAIPVKVNLAKSADANNVKIVSNPTSSAYSVYLSPDQKLAKFAVQPGDQTLVWGRDAAGQQTNQPNQIAFHVTAVSGEAPEGFKPTWKIDRDLNGATIEPPTGVAAFPAAGDVTVEAIIPGAIKPITVPIKVDPKPHTEGGLGNVFGGNGNDPFRSKTPQSTDTSTVNINGKNITVAMTPGPSTVVAGSKGVHFEVKALDGELPPDFHPEFHIVKDSNAATIDQDGNATFRSPGDVTVAAVIPAEAKNEPFYFISSLGKVARGAELLQPKNFDVLAMLLAFAVTMFLSQKLMVQPSTNMDPEQAAIQKQTQQTMPLAVTAMFFFFALPAGVYLYLVVSNVMQTLQTWMIYKTPSAIIHDDEDGDGGTATLNGGKISPEDTGNGGEPGDKVSVSKKKAQKKK